MVFTVYFYSCNVYIYLIIKFNYREAKGNGMLNTSYYTLECNVM